MTVARVDEIPPEHMTLECRATGADEFRFIGDEYVALAEWERDHSYGKGLTYALWGTMDDAFNQHLARVIRGWTDTSRVHTGISCLVYGVRAQLDTDYNVRTQRMHFILRSDNRKYTVEKIVDLRDMT